MQLVGAAVCLSTELTFTCASHAAVQSQAASLYFLLHMQNILNINEDSLNK